MPALPSVPQVLKIVTEYGVGSDLRAINVTHQQYSGTAPTNAQLNNLANGVTNSWSAHLAAMTPPANEYLRTDITDLTSATAGVGFDVNTVAGTRTGGDISADACAILQRKIQRRYRGGHSRCYLPMGTESDLATPNTWNAAFITALKAAWAAYIAQIIAVGWTGGTIVGEVNVSYYSGFTVVTNPITHRARNVPTVRGAAIVDTVTSIGVNPKLGSQRRRNLQSA